MGKGLGGVSPNPESDPHFTNNGYLLTCSPGIILTSFGKCLSVSSEDRTANVSDEELLLGLAVRPASV